VIGTNEAERPASPAPRAVSESGAASKRQDRADRAGVNDEASTRNDPVFVLCMARSGSTLLRFLLDAHPELACPPETKVPVLCTQLASIWSMLEGVALSDEPADDADKVPESALAGVRRMFGDLTGEYLRRRGKRRYCDKSLGVAAQVPVLVKMFPGARFICLYRHPMDMIASGIEACPWGLNGYGFDPYAANAPGNSVHALAHFWVDNATSILAAEERFPEHCHRVLYEDMVTDPETVAAGIFEFLGVSPAPGISHACFSTDREPLGPADFKIWHTSEIRPDSVGRGWALPAQHIRPAMRDAVNELTARLGYLSVDEHWGLAASAPDPRKRGPQLGSGTVGSAQRGSGLVLPPGQRLLGSRVEAGLASLVGDAARADAFRRRWGQFATEAFVVTASQQGRMSLRWRVDLADFTVRIAPVVASLRGASAAWELLGSADSWMRLLNGELNIGMAIRDRQLRYFEVDEGVPGGVRVRLGLLGELLAVTRWKQTAGAPVTDAQVVAPATEAPEPTTV